jgi:hypothetical protein
MEVQHTFLNHLKRILAGIITRPHFSPQIPMSLRLAAKHKNVRSTLEGCCSGYGLPPWLIRIPYKTQKGSSWR